MGIIVENILRIQKIMEFGVMNLTCTPKKIIGKIAKTMGGHRFF